VKDNQPRVKEERADYVQDLHLRNRMDRPTRSEKTSGREDGEHRACSGAVNMRCTNKQGTSDQWH
jgi:hypothetical protein